MGRKKTEHKATYGEIALEKGFITRKKLHECKKESGAHGTSIEKLLTDKGYLTPKQAEIVRNSQDSRIQDTMQSDRDIGKESGEIQKTQQQDSLEIAQSKYLKKSDSKKSVKEAESSLVLEEDSAVSGSSFFGDIAVEMGFANTEQIEKCSQEQEPASRRSVR